MGYNHVFKTNALSLGLVVPIERYDHGPVPTMDDHIERVQLAEELGFSAVWLRDVPFNVPSFGDAGQMFDPFVYLGLLAGMTQTIALGVASTILPLRHPAHVAKAAATADVLSGGRVILGIASGDRPEEFPALNASFQDRGLRFRESLNYIRHVGKPASVFENTEGYISEGLDMLPKPAFGSLPLLVTGGSQQSLDWIAKNGDGWMIYPRQRSSQEHIIKDYRQRTHAFNCDEKPVMEPLYIDLVDDPYTPPTPIHLGLRLGTHHLKEYLMERRAIGVNHIALNLRFNRADIKTTLRRLADDILPAVTT